MANTGASQQALSKDVQDKVVLVTGAGSGIGRAVALLCAAHGGKVMCCDADAGALEDTCQRIQAAGGCCRFVVADVSLEEDCQRLVQTVVQNFGALHLAVNNAGIEGTRARIHEYPAEVYDKVLSVNAKGVWLCLKYEVAQMLRQRQTESRLSMSPVPDYSIVNISSTSGHAGMPEFSAYCMSKWAILGLTKTAAKEYAQEKIRVNAVCPATTDTAMVKRFWEQWPEWQEHTNASYPLGRIAAPEEVAEAVLFLLSERCTFMTGTSIDVDGGSGA